MGREDVNTLETCQHRGQSVTLTGRGRVKPDLTSVEVSFPIICVECASARGFGVKPQWSPHGHTVAWLNISSPLLRISGGTLYLFVAAYIRILLSKPPFRTVSHPLSMDIPDMPVNVPVDDPNADTEWYVAP